MELARILLVLTALAVIGNEATPFRFPLRIPTSFSSWLPFTFNITKDNTDLGSITLNIKPRLGGDVRRSIHFRLTFVKLNAYFRFRQPR